MPVNDVFIGSEALRQGKLSPYQLRTRFHAIFPDVYVAQCTPLSLRTRSEAAWLWSGRRGVLAGLAAAVLHSLSWIDDDEAVELIWRNQHSPGGVTTRNHRVEGGEVTRVAGLPVTTPARTAFDLARRLSLGDAVARLDALMRAKPFSVEDVLLIAERQPGTRGLRQLRAVLPRVDSRRRVSERDVAAAATGRRGLADAGDADPSSGQLSNHRPTGHGMGAIQGRHGIRRRPTPD